MWQNRRMGWPVGTVILASVSLVPGLVLGEDWNQWRGAGRDGVDHASPALLRSLPAEGLQPLWHRTDLPDGWGGGWGSPIIADGIVYVFLHRRVSKGDEKPPERQYPWLPPDKRGHLTPEQYEEYEVKRRNEDEFHASFYQFFETLLAFDAANGEERWRNERPSRYSRFLHSGTPAVVDGVAYWMAPGKVARAVDAKTGKDLWETRLPGEYRDESLMSSFAIVDGIALVQADVLTALDAKSGAILWQGDAERFRGSDASPVVWNDGGKNWVIANVARGDTVLVDPKTGEERWRERTEAGNSTPVVVGDRLITYGDSRKKGLRCYTLSTDGARQEWIYQQASDHGSSPVVVADRVFVQGDRRLHVVDIASGESVWKAPLDLERPQYSSPLAGDGLVLYGVDGLLAFEATGTRGEPVFAAKMDRSGRLASEAFHRERIQQESEQNEEQARAKFREQVTEAGPLECTTPALVDGVLVVRLKNGLVAYRLATPSTATVKNEPQGETKSTANAP